MNQQYQGMHCFLGNKNCHANFISEDELHRIEIEGRMNEGRHCTCGRNIQQQLDYRMAQVLRSDRNEFLARVGAITLAATTLVCTMLLVVV